MDALYRPLEIIGTVVALVFAFACFSFVILAGIAIKKKRSEHHGVVAKFAK